nr:MAG TPA: hypothetical protein [Caudoviricetes sp.]
MIINNFNNRNNYKILPFLCTNKLGDVENSISLFCC